jgi:hypothetical protein
MADSVTFDRTRQLLQPCSQANIKTVFQRNLLSDNTVLTKKLTDMLTASTSNQ